MYTRNHTNLTWSDSLHVPFRINKPTLPTTDKTVTVQVLSEVYPNRTGRVVGIYDTCGAYGGVGASLIVTIFLIAPLSFSFILSPISAESWRGVFFFSGLIMSLSYNSPQQI
jgi:hypothetical protein